MKKEPDIQQLDEMPGANMDTRAVHSHLKKQGWKLTRTSGSHDVFTHPESDKHIPVPRHRKLKAPLVLSILRTSKMRNEEVELEEGSLAMPLKGHAYHYKSDAELKYIQKDAHEAAKAMKGHNPKAEGKYLDQHNDASTVLHYRSKGGKQLQKEETSWQKLQRLRDKREDEMRAKEDEYGYTPKKKEVKTSTKQVVAGHRYGGSKQKDDVNEEFEQLNELSPETKTRYTGAALKSMHDPKPGESQSDYMKRFGKRLSGIKKALGTTNPSQRFQNEETEQIDEISMETHKKYQKAVKKELPGLASHAQSGEYKDIAQNIYNKRVGGMERSTRLQMRNKMAKEEVEQIDEQHREEGRFHPTVPYNVPQTKPAKGFLSKQKTGMNEAKDDREYDYEGDMAKTQLKTIIRNAQKIHDMIEEDENMPEWVQSKITLAKDYIVVSANYLESVMNEEFEQIDEENKPTNPELWSRAVSMAKKKFDVYPSAYANGWAAKWYKEKGGGWKSVSEAVEPPFEPSKPKKDVVVGKRGEGVAKARHLARMAMKKQTEKLNKVTMKNESLQESRKTEVVKELAKKKKEKFEADPVVSDTVVKSDMPQP